MPLGIEEKYSRNAAVSSSQDCSNRYNEHGKSDSNPVRISEYAKVPLSTNSQTLCKCTPLHNATTNLTTSTAYHLISKSITDWQFKCPITITRTNLIT